MPMRLSHSRSRLDPIGLRMERYDLIVIGGGAGGFGAVSG